MDATQRVREAIENTSAEYLQKCLQQRLPGPQRAGSYYPYSETPVHLRSLLESVVWVPYEHPAVKAPAVAFRSALRGVVDLVALADLSPEDRVSLEDPKGTGTVEGVLRGQGHGVRAEHTTILIGPHEGEEVVWSVFPGDPIRPSSVPAEGRAGTTVTVAEALALGLTIAKVAP